MRYAKKIDSRRILLREQPEEGFIRYERTTPERREGFTAFHTDFEEKTVDGVPTLVDVWEYRETEAR